MWCLDCLPRETFRCVQKTIGLRKFTAEQFILVEKVWRNNPNHLLWCNKPPQCRDLKQWSLTLVLNLPFGQSLAGKAHLCFIWHQLGLRWGYWKYLKIQSFAYISEDWCWLSGKLGHQVGAVSQSSYTWPLQVADWLPHSMAGEFREQVSQESKVDMHGIFTIQPLKSYTMACATINCSPHKFKRSVMGTF